MAKILMRTVYLTGFRETVLELGGDPTKMLNELGLSPLILDDPELIIPLDAFFRLLDFAARSTRRRYFGYLLSKRLDLSVLGAIGLLMQNSKTVGDALEHFIGYYPIHFQDNQPELSIEGELAFFTSNTKYSEKKTVQFNLLATGMFVNIMKSLCGENWKPIEIHTIFKDDKNAKHLTQIFKAPFRFSQDRNQMVFAAADLEKKISGASTSFERYIRPQIKEMEKQLPTDIVSQTEYLIRTLLPDGACNVENVTALLSITERSLQRKLKARRTTFRQLVDNVRKSIARQQLRQANLSNTELAFILGYTELSAFSRAFKRWFGMAPSKWKGHSSI